MPRATQIDNIDNYMKSISVFPLLTKEEEISLYYTMHGKNPDAAATARQTLIQCNLRLVVKIAHDFKRFNLPFSDLVAEGNAGLMTAVDKFDPSKGAKFSCYAAWWIKQAMRKAMAEKPWLIRLPQEQVKRRVRIDHARAALIAANDYEPTEEDLAEATGFSVNIVHNASFFPMDIVSMNTPMDQEDGESADFNEILTQEPKEPEEKQSRYALLDTLIAELCDLDRFIVTRTYGIECTPIPTHIIAQETGLSSIEVENRLSSLLARFKDRLSQ